MSTDAPMNDDELSKVGFVMGGVWYTEEELEASLNELRPDLERAFNVSDLALAPIDPEHARFAMAQAISFTAALQNIRGEPDVERLMLVVGFIDEEDQFDARAIKGVALDKMLATAIDYERESLTGDVGQAIGRLDHLRRQAATALCSRGYADRYYQIQNGLSA